MWVYVPSECCPCSPESAASTWVSDWLSRMPGSCAMSKLTDIASGSSRPGSKTEPFVTHLFGTILPPLTGDPGVATSTWYAAASRARISPWPAGARGSKKGTAAASGTNTSGLFAQWSPAGFLSKTCQGSLFEESTPYSGDWPKAGSLRSGACFQRPAWVRPTSASASSSSAWPTPCKQDPKRKLIDGESVTGEGVKWGTSLTQYAEQLWPTPNVPNGGRTLSPEAVAAKGATARGKRQVGLENVASLWPTPKASAENYGQPRDDDRGDLQAAAVGLWATPTSRDWRSGECSEATWERNARPLNEQVCHSSHPDPPTGTPGPPSSPSGPTSRRQLNVSFVEWLQGFPIGFSDLKPLATPWSRFRQLARSRCLWLVWRIEEQENDSNGSDR
jgi:hypothetical protein